MKQVLSWALALMMILLIGCGGDDNGPVDPPPPTVVRIVANSTVGAPDMGTVDAAQWNSVTATAIDVSSSFAPPKIAGSQSLALAPDSVYLKAIVAGGDLYLRVEYDNDSLNLLKDHLVAFGDSKNFTRNTMDDEDRLYVMFVGLPGDTVDVWSWRSLETSPARLAEGYRYSNGTFIRDAGAQEVYLTNALAGSRPTYVHNTGDAFTGGILYMEDMDPFNYHLSDAWVAGTIVPGYVIDSATGSRVRTPAYEQSRWDIFAVDDHDAVLGRQTVALQRELSTGYPDDLVMADSVQVYIGVVDNLHDFSLVGSRRGFTEPFWIIF